MNGAGTQRPVAADPSAQAVVQLPPHSGPSPHGSGVGDGGTAQSAKQRHIGPVDSPGVPRGSSTTSSHFPTAIVPSEQTNGQVPSQLSVPSHEPTVGVGRGWHTASHVHPLFVSALDVQVPTALVPSSQIRLHGPPQPF